MKITKSGKNRGEHAGILIAMFIIGLIVLTVGGIMACKLLETIKTNRIARDDEPPQPGTQVYVWMVHMTNFVVWATNCPCITNNPTATTVTNCPCPTFNYSSAHARSEEGPHFTFGLQYGLDKIGSPWVVEGTNLPPNEPGPQPILVIVPLRSSATNLEQFLYLDNGEIWLNAINVETNGSLVATTEFFGPWTPPKPTGDDIVIENAPTPTGPWEPIFTNRVSAGSVWNFIDTKGDPVSGFYRTIRR